MFSVSAIAIGLFNLSMAVSISLWRNSLFKMFVKLCELFYLVWIIIGNVWIFWFTPITTFGTSNSTSSNTTTPPLNTTTSNSTATTNDLNCALLEGHAFAFMIAFWIVSCVVVCLLGDNAEEDTSGDENEEEGNGNDIGEEGFDGGAEVDTSGDDNAFGEEGSDNGIEQIEGPDLLLVNQALL